MKKYTIYFKLEDHEETQAFHCDSEGECYNLLLFYAKSLDWWELYNNYWKSTKDAEPKRFMIASRRYS